jgi:hypothetical protein
MALNGPGVRCVGQWRHTACGETPGNTATPSRALVASKWAASAEALGGSSDAAPWTRVSSVPSFEDTCVHELLTKQNAADQRRAYWTPIPIGYRRCPLTASERAGSQLHDIAHYDVVKTIAARFALVTYDQRL